MNRKKKLKNNLNPKRDPSLIESDGIAKLESCLSKSGYLKTFFKKEDKTPSFDGYILVYNSKKLSKENIFGKIHVQIKATENKNIDCEYQNISVEKSDLENFLKVRGAVFFLICLGNNDKFSIYYSALTVIKLKKYLKNTNNNTISINLQIFPKDNIVEYTNILVNFTKEINCNTSNTIISLNDYFYKKPEGYNDLTISYISIDDKLNHNHIFSNPVYVHAVNKSADTEITLGEYIVKGIAKEENCNVEINGKKYFDKIIRILKKDELIIYLEDSFTIILRFKEERVDFNFNMNGNLAKRIRDISFLLDLLKYGYISYDNNKILFKFTEKELLEINPVYKIEYFSNQLNYLNTIKETLDILGIKKHLEFENWKKIDEVNIKFLISSIKNGETIQVNNHTEDYVFKTLKVGNLLISIYMEKQEDGKYKISNYFDINRYALISKKNNRDDFFIVSPYILMEYNNIMNISNINYDIIYESFIKLPDNENFFELTISFIFEMIKAYDALDEKDEELLSCAMKLNEWLLTKKIDKTISTMNKMQIIRRLRKLNDEEIAVLLEIVNKSNKNIIRTGVYILLDNSILAKKYYDKLTKPEKREFDTNPINLFRKFDILEGSQ